jgi:hypothetical protein
VGAGHDVLEDGQRREQRHVLERAGDADLDDLVGGDAQEVPLVERDLAGVGLVQPADDVEEGGLAGPVGADQGADLALLDGEREAVERHDAAEPDPDLFDTQQWHSHPPPGSGQSSTR